MEEKETVRGKNLLIIIDPQNDFVNTDGTLYINGAEKAMKNLCELIRNGEGKFDQIIITQDTHQCYHIGHGVWWEQMPEPFTKITLQDIIDEKYTSMNKYPKELLEAYFSKLPGQTHTIWPEHCIEGSWGWCFPKDFVESLNLYCLKYMNKTGCFNRYQIIQKGQKATKEMFSAFSYADGDKNDDIITKNYWADRFNKIYITGFAKDVCVAYSVKDLIESGKFDGKLVFLDSCMAGLDPKSEMLKVYEDAVNNHGAVWE